MKKILVGILIVAMLFSIGCTSIESGASNPTGQETAMGETHYGGAILLKPAREASKDIYTSSDIQKVSGFKNFDREITVYGLTLIIHKDISDEFATKISKMMVSMFPKLEGESQKTQETILQNMYKYKAALPVVPNEEAIGEDQAKLMKEYSLCDIIMKTKDNQVNEVVEHLLHAITDVGLSYTFPKEWGFEKTSTVSQLMQKDIDASYYNIKDYQGFPDTIKHRVLVQEYAYWVISSSWDFQAVYGTNAEEYKLLSLDKLNQSQPEIMKLIKGTVDPYMVKPSEETIKSFQ